MRFVILLLALLLSTLGAEAAFVPPIISPQFFTPPRIFPPKFVEHGGQVTVWEVTALNPDCSVTGRVAFNILKAPAHGAVRVITTGVFPAYPRNNVRSVCNGRKVTGQRVLYTAQAGFTGKDFVQFETIYPAGMAFITSVPIIVR